MGAVVGRWARLGKLRYTQGYWKFIRNPLFPAESGDR